MEKVKVKGKEYELEDRDAALIQAIQELTYALRQWRGH